MPGAPINDGLRFLLDQNQRFNQVGPPCYLVVQNYTEAGEINSLAEELGFAVTVAASGQAQAGTAKILIDPQPTVKNMSMHNIGMAAQSGLQLSAGAKVITISHTFVKQQMTLRNLLLPRLVFEDQTTVGILVGDVLMSIVSANSNDAFGDSISWTIIGNSSEEG